MNEMNSIPPEVIAALAVLTLVLGSYLLVTRD